VIVRESVQRTGVATHAHCEKLSSAGVIAKRSQEDKRAKGRGTDQLSSLGSRGPRYDLERTGLTLPPYAGSVGHSGTSGRVDNFDISRH
jgi:hypothetical protein